MTLNSIAVEKISQDLRPSALDNNTVLLEMVIIIIDTFYSFQKLFTNISEALGVLDFALLPVTIRVLELESLAELFIKFILVML